MVQAVQRLSLDQLHRLALAALALRATALLAAYAIVTATLLRGTPDTASLGG